MDSNPFARRTPTGFLFSLAQFYCTLNIFTGATLLHIDFFLLAQFYSPKQDDRVL
jgi:hypothetical protein